jgi:hypothetical protein
MRRRLRRSAAQALALALLVFCLSAPAPAYRPNKDTAKNRQDRTISVGKGRISINDSSGPSSGSPSGDKSNRIEVRPTERSENDTQPSFNGTIEVKPIVVWPKKK